MLVESYGIFLSGHTHVLKLDKDSCRHSLSVEEQIVPYNLVSSA